MANAVQLRSQGERSAVILNTLVTSVGASSLWYDTGGVRRATLMIEVVAGAVTLKIRDAEAENFGPSSQEVFGVGDTVYNLEAGVQFQMVSTDEGKVTVRPELF